MHDQVVDRESAGRYWGQDTEVVAKDHSSIVKPLDNQDLSFRILKDFVLRQSNIVRPLCTIDIGEVIQPLKKDLKAHIPFTVHNYTDADIKITSLILCIKKREKISIVANGIPKAFRRPHKLTAKLTATQDEYEILDDNTLTITVQESSDAFHLEIESEPGYQYEVFLKAQWHIIGQEQQAEVISYPTLLTFLLIPN